MRIRSVLMLLLVFSAYSVVAQTNSATAVAVPTLVRYSGTLPGPPGRAALGVTFALYKDQVGGAPLWLETQNITLDGNGRYTVNLGTNHAGGIPAELFAAGEARWLGVQPEGQPEQPRVLLVSVPYAMKAADADTLGGLPASSYVTLDQFSVGGRQSPVTSQSSAAAEGPVTPSPCNAITSDGTALANYLTKFTAPCNIENSGIYQSALATTPGFLGIGTTAPVAPLDMEPAAQTGTSGGLFGVHVIANFNPTGNSTGNYYAFYGQSNSSMGNTTNFTGDLVGSGFIAQHYGTGTVSNLFGANYSVQNRSTGTVTNAVGFFGGVSNLGAGTITNGYGLQVPVPQNSGGGTFTNFYGVYIANPTGITNSWGLYSLANTNYMSGKLGVGVMAPTQALEINGNLKFDTAGHGITYADGTVQTTASLPGSGTITKVTAGTDLTGGGSSGAVTLNLDTTKVPTLAAENTFSAGQIINDSTIGNGLQATTTVSNGNGVYGIANNGGSAYGVLGMSTSGRGVVGIGNTMGGNFTAAGGPGVSATGTTVGGSFSASSGVGVSGAGTTYGGYFVLNGTAGVGVYAAGGTDSTGGAGGNGGNFTGGTETNGGVAGDGVMATGGAGTNGTFSSGGTGGSFQGGASDSTFGGDGVTAQGGSTSSTSESAGVGIYAQGGHDGNSASNDAGYFNGNIAVTGAITAGMKDFKIDHPLDPANKYLYHASVESSEMKNIYDGTVTTNQEGFAAVRLPDWFEAVNTDFRYQLTVIGQFAQAIVAQKISSGQFVIRTDKPNVEVCWLVTGVRQDAFAKAYPLQVEVEKPERERGYYIHPELYGAPHEKQVVFATHPGLLKGPDQVKPHAPNQPQNAKRPQTVAEVRAK